LLTLAGTLTGSIAWISDSNGPAKPGLQRTICAPSGILSLLRIVNTKDL
jgi:hypothetical protein